MGVGDWAKKWDEIKRKGGQWREPVLSEGDVYVSYSRWHFRISSHWNQFQNSGLCCPLIIYNVYFATILIWVDALHTVGRRKAFVTENCRLNDSFEVKHIISGWDSRLTDRLASPPPLHPAAGRPTPTSHFCDSDTRLHHHLSESFFQSGRCSFLPGL